MWKTGVASVSFRGHTPQQIIEAAAAAGLDGIEWGADVHVPAGDVATAQQVRAATEAAGLQVLSYGGYYRIGQNDPAAFDALLASAEALGVQTVRIWGGDKGSAAYDEAGWQALVTEARTLAAGAAQKNMVLSLECHNDTITDDWQSALRFVQAVDSPALRLYWQPNQLKSEPYDLQALRSMTDYLTHVHVFFWQLQPNGDVVRRQLSQGTDSWEKYLTILQTALGDAPAQDHALLLEFMPDDRIESLAGEALVLNEFLGRRGMRAMPRQDAALPVLLPMPRHIRLQPDMDRLTFIPDGTICLDDRALYPAVRTALDYKRLSGLHIVLDTLRAEMLQDKAPDPGAPQPDAPTVVLVRDADLANEGYRLWVQPVHGRAQVHIRYATPVGAFYALMTLQQLLAQDPCSLPAVDIDDAPDYPVRGYMLDVGRNRIPTQQELTALVQRLASWKINQLQLYMEGVPFAYPSFPDMWYGHEVLTGEDVLALDVVCQQHFIELVPTQNNFGHMAVWLQERFRHLSECPDGFTFDGNFLPDPFSMDPQDPGSLQLVQQLADDLLPYFSSGKYNICCDETLELGMGKSRALCEERGMEAVYVDFVAKVCEVAHAAGRQPLIWDDIIRHDPEQLQRLPKDAILLDWGYSASQPYEPVLARLQSLGCRYYVCPGTGSWNSYLGETDKMMPNILRAGRLGLTYGAEGMLVTDWGDAGHLQSISAGYAGIAFAAATAWGVTAAAEMDLATALSIHVFEDVNGCMGRLALDAARYKRYEGISTSNSTYSMRMMFQPSAEQVKGVDPASFERVQAYMQSLLPLLEAADMRCPDADKIKQEYRWAIWLVHSLQFSGMAYAADAAGDSVQALACWKRLKTELTALKQAFCRVWAARCRQAWLEESLKQFDKLLVIADQRIAALQKD